MQEEMQQEPKLVSIERVVAFIFGPIVVAASGTLSVLAAQRLHIHISGEQITGIFASGAVTAGALAWKWLHGRQITEQVEGSKAIRQIEKELPEGFLATTAHDLEGMAEKVVSEFAARIGLQQPIPTPPPPPGS